MENPRSEPRGSDDERQSGRPQLVTAMIAVLVTALVVMAVIWLVVLR
jgi:hypothetical protein